MSPTVPRPVVAGDARVRDPAIRLHLRRFCRAARRDVFAVAALDPRLADLAVSFPAVLHKLAVPGAAFDPWPGILAVVEGRKLADVASLLELPMWTRRLPPEAFHQPIGPLPDGSEFARRIVNHLPKTADAGPWFKAVRETAQIADPEAALWVASLKSPIPEYLFRRVCLWVWFSRRPQTLGHRLAGDSLWFEGIGRNAAFTRVRRWTEQCDFYFENGDGDAGTDPWFAPQTIDGFTFRPLTTLWEVAAAGRAMENCALTYGQSLAAGCARLWLVSKGSEPMAMVELRRVAGAGHAYAEIGQVRGVANKSVPRAVLAAVYRWWLDQPRTDLPRPPTPDGDSLGQARYARWRAFWLPYRVAKVTARPDWLPSVGKMFQLEDI